MRTSTTGHPMPGESIARIPGADNLPAFESADELKARMGSN